MNVGVKGIETEFLIPVILYIILGVIDIATENVLVVAGVVILAVAVILYGRKRRHDRVMYLF